MRRYEVTSWLLAIGVLIAGGCSSAKSQLSTCERDKQQLLAQVVEQQRVVENLRLQNQVITERLAESERLLARIHEQTAGGVARHIQPQSVESGSNGPSGWKPTGQK